MNPKPEQDQSGVFAFFQNPATYERREPVVRIDTHGAAVFLAGPDVYKVKRAVHFSFMDFSTLAKRHAACDSEIAVNRGNAPDICLDVVPITRDGRHFRLGGHGLAIESAVQESAVHLRRFDESATLDRLGDAGPLGAELIDKLAQAVVVAHGFSTIR